MAQRSIGIVQQEPFAVGARRQSHESSGYGSASLGTTAMFSNAHDLRIVDSTLTIAGGDVVHSHNIHYHYERPRDIWAILQSIPNFRKIYQDMLSKATLGTGIWLVKGDKFRLWLEPNGDIKIFWGSGIPGAGKTLLAAIVIEHLEALCQEPDAKICVCYVFFRYSNHAEVTVRNIVEILVMQTLERHPEHLALVEKTYARHLRERTEPTEAQLLALLQQLNEGMTVTFYVLDALDEAPTKIQLAVVKTLASLNVKLFITSRPLKTVEANFPEAFTLIITAQDYDIDLHIAKGLAENADLQHMIQQAGPSLREEIVSTIKRNCGGMFLHAALQLDELRDCYSAQNVRDTLRAFPSEIEDVYRQTWARIRNQGRNPFSLAKAVLLWVLYASRSMTVEELERAVATSPRTHKFEASRLVPGTTLISLCRGLVIVEEESKLVRLVHYTAQDTLEGLLDESFPHPHSLLAAVCMTHLADCGFQNTTISSEEEFKTALKNDPLLAYASEAWDFHARSGLDVEETKRQTVQFVGQSHAFPAFTSPDRTWYFDILTPLHMLGLYHLPLGHLQEAVLDKPVETTQILRQSPLTMASWSGHQDLVVRLLVLPEIQVNWLDVHGWSSLMRAAHLGHEGIVALLLTSPVILVNLVNHNGWSALIAAARKGHEGVVKLLLAHPEIQINLVATDGWSALIWAASEGHEGVITLLLEHPEIQVNLVIDEGWSALVWAAYEGHEGVVRLLLTHPEIQVNLVNNEGCSALLIAARWGHEDVVTLLLAHPDIQVNLVRNDGCSTLMRAAPEGHEGVVKLLLAHPEIQVNLRNSYGSTALTCAAQEGHKGVITLLLAHPEIQVDLVTNDGWSALIWAAHEGHEGAVTLLLAHPGIQINLVTNDGWSALIWAAHKGHEGVVTLLLAHPEIQVNLVTNDGWSALISAARGGHEGILTLLLARPEIQVNLIDNEGWSALLIAARWGHEGVVTLLLAHPDIQVNLATSHGSTALLLAAQHGHTALVRVLFATGLFDINAYDQDRDTAIKMAAEKGHEAVLRLFLDSPSVDTTIRSTTDGHTAISAAQANGHSVIVQLLRDVESPNPVIASPPAVVQLTLQDSVDENASDSDNSELYQDAEEGFSD